MYHNIQRAADHLNGRLEPNMLKNLHIIPSRTSQNFYLLFLFYSQVPPIIPFLFYCVNDITIQDWLLIDNLYSY